MQVKKASFLKTVNEDILKISTNIKNFIIKMQGEINKRIINEFAKTINDTKKECQKLNAENIRYKGILQQEQEPLQKE